MQAGRDKQLTAQGLERIGTVWADRESLDNLHGFPDRPFHLMQKPRMDMPFYQHIFHDKLSPSQPPNDCSRGLDPLPLLKRDGNEIVSPGLMGKSPESRQPVHERFTPRRGLESDPLCT